MLKNHYCDLEPERLKVDNISSQSKTYSDGIIFSSVDTCDADELNNVSRPPNPKMRKLILHIDLRNTIIVADTVTNIDIEQAINSYLTGVLWGREMEGQWSWVSEKPSLLPPEPNTITYYKYLERSMVSKPSDRAQLRIATGDFTKKEIGAKFRQYFEKYLPMLKWNNRELSDDTISNCGSNDSGIETESRLSNSSLESICSKTGNLLTTSLIRNGFKEYYHYIIPSFVKFLKYLCDEHREFVIILRTYGMDAPSVLTSIKHIIEGCSHPNFPKPRPTSVCFKIGNIKRFSLDGDHKTKLTVDRSLFNFLTIKQARPVQKHNLSSQNTSESWVLMRVSNRKRFGDTTVKKDVKKLSFGSDKMRLFRDHVQEGIKIVKSLLFNDCNPCCNQHGINGNAELKPKFNSTSDLINICGDEKISDSLNKLKGGVYAFVDDFIHWQNHGYDRLSGKPIWIVLPEDVNIEQINISNHSLEDDINIPEDDEKSMPSRKHVNRPNHPTCTSETHHHIFFDDNIRVSEEDSIVDIRLYDWKTGKWRSSTQEETELCEDVFLVQANLLESLENENYFIEKLRKCEMNLDNILEHKKMYAGQHPPSAVDVEH